MEVPSKPRYHVVDGMRLPPTFLAEVVRSGLKYKPVKEDVVVVTFPKCGTTWSIQICNLILRKGVPPLTAEDYFSTSPFQEITPAEVFPQLTRPFIVKTHMPYDRLQISPEAKYIYVARHPADCVVSFFHHTRYFPIYFFTNGNFNDFFELFINGETDFNDYFHNLLSWYEKRNLPNVLFLTYEAMKKDQKAAILQIARFLGEDYYESLLANDGEVLQKVLDYSSVKFMKETVSEFWNQWFTTSVPQKVQDESAVMKRFAELLEEAMAVGHRSRGEFVRKGEVGDGKIVLSAEQMEKLQKRIAEKTAHSDVMDLWK